MTVTPVIPASPKALERDPAAPARALAARLYLDPQTLALEQQRIFERTWQLAGHVSQLPQPGSYLTAQAGTQPVLVVRDEDGSIRAYRNVCRHRGSRLLTGSGQCRPRSAAATTAGPTGSTAS